MGDVVYADGATVLADNLGGGNPPIDMALLTALNTAFAAGLNSGGAGIIDWSFDLADTAVDFLAAGETVTEVHTVTVNDGQVGTAEQTVSVTITGTNDPPVILIPDHQIHKRPRAHAGPFSVLPAWVKAPRKNARVLPASSRNATPEP
jgi:VCBS repeat-containing protein